MRETDAFYEAVNNRFRFFFGKRLSTLISIVTRGPSLLKAYRLCYKANGGVRKSSACSVKAKGLSV